MATTWQDAKHRTWSITLTLELADAVLAVAHVDLLPENNSYEAVTLLACNPRKLALVLWECSRKAADSIGVDYESFRTGLDADAYHAGWKALQEAIAVFFSVHQPALGDMIRQGFTTQEQGLGASCEATVRTMQSQEMDEAVRQGLSEIDRELRSSLKAEISRAVQAAREKPATS